MGQGSLRPRSPCLVCSQSCPVNSEEARQSSPTEDNPRFPETGTDAERGQGHPAATSLKHPMKVAESRRTCRPQLCPRTPRAAAGKEPHREVARSSPPALLGPLQVPRQHLLAEQLAAHAAPEPGTGVGGPLAPRLLQRIQAAALQGLAHRFQAAVGLRQNVSHAGGRGLRGQQGTRGRRRERERGVLSPRRPGSYWSAAGKPIVRAPLSPPFCVPPPGDCLAGAPRLRRSSPRLLVPAPECVRHRLPRQREEVPAYPEGSDSGAGGCPLQKTQPPGAGAPPHPLCLSPPSHY